jgi:GNAT superfamily N-acetyltransferase
MSSDSTPARGVRVRRLQPRDRSAWEALFRAYIAFYRAAVPGDVIDTTWARIVASPPEIEGLIAVDGSGAPLGIALVVLHRSTWSATWYCYLEDLYVVPEARGRGVGRALIEAVYRLADARGATRTYWVTEADNANARALYDKVATRAPFVQYRR